MTPAFASWNEFFAMGGYAFFFFCLAGGGDDRYSAGGFGRALGDATSRNSAWRGATAGA